MMRAPHFVFVVCMFLAAGGCGGRAVRGADRVAVPEPLRRFVSEICASTLGGLSPRVHVQPVEEDVYHFRLVFTLPEAVQQDDWSLAVRPAFEPDFHWSPHLTPTVEHIIDQHSFRSPALIVSDRRTVLALVPDLEILGRGTAVRWYMDLDASTDTLTLGMSDYDVREHVLYVRKPGATYPAGEIEIGFFLRVSSASSDVRDPWRWPLGFLWERWGRERFETEHPLPPDLTPYVEHTYNWAFAGWKASVWQEFVLGDKRVGAPVFIVNQTQSPNYPGEVDEREFRSVWNQAWFSSLRSASGLFRHARRRGDEDLLRRARLTKELALASPMRDGFFPSLIATDMEIIERDGRTYNRSRGWQTAFWGNSDRNPVNRPPDGSRSRDPRIAPYHVLDMSWTALLMLRWYDELEKDSRLLDYAERYAEALLGLQSERGFFPAWLDVDTFRPLGLLDESPETSMSVTFLLKLADLTGDRRYRDAAVRAMNAVAEVIVPQGRWEDFETYWSCSSFGKDAGIGKKIERNDMFKQTNLSMFWTAEALLETYHETADPTYLELGQRVLDEMLMTQASWQPPYMYVDVLGGFGVMNADGEWNDSRESLFAELIVRYGMELGVEEYVQRGLAALRASFVMMYCPENPRTKELWEKTHVFFGREDYGFTMENYGHGGKTSPEGEGMGVFTIYDWGNGAAAEAYNRMLDHFGPDLVHRSR